MKNQRRIPKHSPLALAIVAAVLVAFLALALRHNQRRTDAMARLAAQKSAAQPPGASGATAAQRAAASARAAASRATLAEFRARLAERLSSPNARPNEATLAFKNEDAYRRFLARADAAGLTIISSSPKLLSARVHYDSLDALTADIAANADDLAEVGANHTATAPPLPPLDERTTSGQVPVRDNLLAAIGLAPDADNSSWGRGVTVAVIDTGILADATFGADRVRALDIGHGTAAALAAGADNAHGTAVASIIAGALADALGIAPEANLLSIRATDDTGTSDMFTIASAIIAAADNGAQIINISLGGYGGSIVLTRAIDYAMQNGAVVVAAAGNDQSTQLVWPAANPRVISVGATDAAQQLMLFSNAGWQLQITAPGYAIQAAWGDGQRAPFTGTSASTPVVSGAIAAYMSLNPGMSAQDAWAAIQSRADDAGAQGRDPDYGAGVVDLGWALDTDPARVDMAIAGHVYDALANTIDVVVQNRGAAGMAGATLNVNAGGERFSYELPWLDPGASATVKIPVTADANGQMLLRTTLVNPGGSPADKTPANNTRTSVITLPKK